MISVYYNQKYGFLIVPNAIERFMGCYISIEPTIEIMAEETIDKIGCAIRKGIKFYSFSNCTAYLIYCFFSHNFNCRFDRNITSHKPFNGIRHN